jgi:hypothetical protein
MVADIDVFAKKVTTFDWKNMANTIIMIIDAKPPKLVL